MRTLVVEDNFANRLFMKKFLTQFGECDIVVDGIEAIDAYLNSLKDNLHYDLICIDVMMPGIDGINVLKSIRNIEKQNNIEESKKAKIIMTTALNDKDTVLTSYESGSDAYATKPIDIEKFKEVLKKLDLIK